MKLLCTSDWHLGKTVFGRSMLEDQRYFIENSFYPLVGSGEYDAVLLAGDIFDRSVAPPEALALFDEVLGFMTEHDVPLLAITGNHDGAQRLSLGTRLWRRAGIYLATSLNECLTPIRLGETEIFLLPYFEPAEARALLGAQERMSCSELYCELTEKMSRSMTDGCTQLLLSHCTVLGSSRCDSESAGVGGAAEISAEAFAPFDFSVLGHLHSPQQIRETVRYCGSPLRYSFDRNERDKAFLVLETGEAGVTASYIPITPLRELVTLRGSFDELMNGEQHLHDYITAELTDDSLIYAPKAKLEQRYDFVLGLKYVGRGAGSDAAREQLREDMRTSVLSDEQVFRCFVREMRGAEPEESDVRLFLSLMDEVRREEAAK